MIRSRLLLVACLLSVAPPAKAQPAPAATASAAPAGPLSVHLSLPASAAPAQAERIRAAIEQELRVTVVLSDAPATPLEVAVDGVSCRVTYTAASGEVLSRNIDLPELPERRAEVIALLVGNLTRDEAADLLAALRAAHAPPAPPPPKKSATSSAAPARPAPPVAKAAPAPLIRQFPAVNLSLFHPIALRPDSERRALQLELGLAYSRVGAIEGMGANLGALRVEQHADGLAAAIFYARVGGGLRGLAVSSGYTEVRGESDGMISGGLVALQSETLNGFGLGGLVYWGGALRGVSIGGLLDVSDAVTGGNIGGVVALARGPVDGLLMSGLYTSAPSLSGVNISTLNVIRGPSLGVSVGAVANIAQQSDSLAIAGLANVTGASSGWFVSGAVNVTGSLRGLAISGAVNRTRDLEGGAIALVNVSERVRGFQLGLVNVATEVEGAQLGVVNVAKAGRVQAEFLATNLVPLNAGLKFVSRYSYSELLLHRTPSEDLSGLSLGLGGRLPLGPAALELGARGAFSFSNANPNETPERIDLHYQGRASVRLASFIEPFVGAGARHGLFRRGSGELAPEFFGGVALF